MTNFLLAMTLHPEAFQKAQAELDRVVGRARLPDFDDRGSLPYLDCVISEVLRCVSSSPRARPVPLARPSRMHVLTGGSFRIRRQVAVSRPSRCALRVPGDRPPSLVRWRSGLTCVCVSRCDGSYSA